MIILALDVSRDETIRVTCHPDDREMLSLALQDMPAEIVESPKCKRGEWLTKIVPRIAAVLVALTIFCGCADMSRDRDAKPSAQPRASGDSLAWARQWELLASAAEAETPAEEHDRLLDAMEHAAAMRDGRRIGGGDGATHSKPDPTAATLNRAAEALAELGGQK